MRLRPRRLLVRVYLFGVLLLVCVAAAQFAVGHLLLRPTSRSNVRLQAAWIVDKALPVDANSETAHQELAALQQQLGIQVSLFDAESRLLDSTASPPLAPLAKDELERLRTARTLLLRKRSQVGVGRFHGQQLVGYALATPRRPEPPPWRVILPMLLALLLVTAASIPFARSLTKPIERLAATAQRLGQGDLRVRDVTDSQDEVGDLARAINEMAERIEQLMRSEKQLLANVSHELRTPLARIRVALELADSSQPSAHYLSEIAEDLAEIERMVEDILTATKLDLAQEQVGRSTTPLRLQETDPRQVLDQAVARFAEHHQERRLIVEAPAQLPTLHADPAMLRRVLDNLLENADKYSNSELAITLRARQLQGGARPAGLEFEIADQGIGIDAADLPLVFTPFFRSDRSRARSTGGVGLGLPLAQRIVRAHGGAIELHSEVGVGTTATVWLPLG